MSVVTKRGDQGHTDLMFSRKIPKTDIRVTAYGGIDELNAAFGLVRVTSEVEEVKEAVEKVQKELVVLMGELATDSLDQERYVKEGYPVTTTEMVSTLEEHIKFLESKYDITFAKWSTPGAKGSLPAAHLDVARTICRRCEREVLDLAECESVNDQVSIYLNRLSDWCWVLARVEETLLEEERESAQ